MDNASKALIIAGAILIAVMLVSLGVMLYNTAAGVAESTTGTVESLGVEGYNAQFNQYMGERQRASVAQGLIDKVIANNANSDTTISVQLLQGTSKAKNLTAAKTSDSTALTNMRNKITTKNTVYKIEVGSYDTSGTINFIKISGVAK